MTRSASLRDDRGAIMLIAVFFAVFAVALLYYLIGISSSVLYREKFQDAADAAALSAAVMRARGMNLIVLINIIMAALLSVLVTIKLIETVAIIGIGIAAAAAWGTCGATLVAIPPLNSVRASTHSAFEGLRGPIFDALVALHNVAGAVKTAAPVVADTLTIADIAAKSEPTGTRGVTFDTRPTEGLPVQDGDFSTLCDHAGQFPFQLARDALSGLPGVSELMGALASPMGQLSSQFSSWFCGDGSSGPPTYDQQNDVSYPRTDLVNQCRDDKSAGDQLDPTGTYLQVNPKNATSAACNKGLDEEQDAQADPNTGDCQAGHSCSLGGPYDTHVALAREQCDPTVEPSPFVYFYQARSGQVEYKWNGKLWARKEPAYAQPSYSTSYNRPPCGPSEFSPVVARSYNKTVRSHADVNEVLPVCSNEEAPWVPPASGIDATTKTVSFTEVLQMLGCKRKETKHITMDGALTAGNSGSDKAPKKVEETAELGDENFQVRAIMNGNLTMSVPDRAMHLALWNQVAPDNPFSALRDLGHFSVAQAEYFYDANGPRSEWMWNMNWRVRLRRFRLPTGSTSDALGHVCDKLGGACGSFLGQAKKFENIVAH